MSRIENTIALIFLGSLMLAVALTLAGLDWFFGGYVFGFIVGFVITIGFVANGRAAP